MKARIALSVLVVLAAFALALAANPEVTKFTKQTGGGSTGDSLTSTADTSAAIFINRDVTSLRVIAAFDTAATYTTQISPDATYWFTVDFDSVAAGGAEATADFGDAYNKFYVRSILSTIPDEASPFGAAWLQVTK